MAFKNDLSFRIEVLALIPIAIAIYYFSPLEIYEYFSLLITYGLIILTELVNTSIEAALDKLHPVRHHMIGLSKDVAASAVVVSVFMFLIVFGIVIYSHI